MSYSTRDLLVHGIAAAKAKEADEARRYLERALNTEPDFDQKIVRWLNERSLGVSDASWLQEFTYFGGNSLFAARTAGEFGRQR